jgi:mxaJ protein
VWGPLAGYFAKHEKVPLEIVPLPALDRSGLALAFDISVGVKKEDKGLRDEVNAILARDRSRVEKILDDYGVPRVAGGDVTGGNGTGGNVAGGNVAAAAAPAGAAGSEP